MEAIEIVAATLKEATEKAADQLGVDKAQLNVTVLEETKGLFGKGQVRVRAEVKAGPAKAKEAKPKEPRAKAAKAKEPEPVVDEPQAVVVEDAKPEKKARPAKKEAARPERPAKTKSSEPDKEPSEESSSEVVASKKDADQVISLLNEMMSESGLQVSADISEMKGKYINLSLGGRDVSYLVGRRGEVLNALQYLMNVIVARQLESGVRVVVDGDNFRRRREEVLEKLAFDIANEVQKRGEEAVLDALPAFERRVIHQALSEFDGVVTYSEGEEPDRRVVIAPAEATTA